MKDKLGLLFIVSGPAGVGKTTVVNNTLKCIPNNELQRSITTTTRNPRPGEIEGVHYFFVSEEEFQKKIKKDEFLEYAIVHNSTYYGSSKSEVYKNIKQGINTILVIDVQGYNQIIKQQLDIKIVSIFIKPSNINVLRKRLILRGSETKEEIEKRLQVAEYELQFTNQYKYIINSSSKKEDLRQFLNIYNMESKQI